MRPIGEDPRNDLSLLDPEKHAPLAELAVKVRDAYAHQKRLKAERKRARRALRQAVEAYASERLTLFMRLLQERKLGCCVRCGAIVHEGKVDWLLIRHLWVTDEGYDADTKVIYMVRACGTCRAAPRPGQTVPFVWLEGNRLREQLTQARKTVDGGYEVQTWSIDAQGPVWTKFDPGCITVYPREVPLHVPIDLPADIESALPPLIDTHPACKEHFGFDPEYVGVRRGTLLLITKNRQEKL